MLSVEDEVRILQIVASTENRRDTPARSEIPHSLLSTILKQSTLSAALFEVAQAPCPETETGSPQEVGKVCFFFFLFLFTIPVEPDKKHLGNQTRGFRSQHWMPPQIEGLGGNYQGSR